MTRSIKFALAILALVLMVGCNGASLTEPVNVPPMPTDTAHGSIGVLTHRDSVFTCANGVVCHDNPGK